MNLEHHTASYHQVSHMIGFHSLVPYLDLVEHTVFYSSPGTDGLITYQDVRPSADDHTCIQFRWVPRYALRLVG